MIVMIMRIVEISPIIGSGSVGRIVDQIYRGLIEQGHQCKVICGKIGNTSVPSADYMVMNNGLTRRANAAFARLFDCDGFFTVTPMEKAIGLIDNFKPDIIHMHGAYGYFLDVRPLYDLIKQKDYNLVNTLHSCWDYTGHCCYYTYAGCDRWKSSCHDCPEKKAYPTSLFLDNSERNYQKKKELFSGIQHEVIVTPSKWLADEVERSFLSKYPVVVINNGVNVNTFKKIPLQDRICYQKYGIPDNKIIILGVAGIWDRRKGLEDFVQLEKIIDEDMKIVILGVSEKQKKQIPEGIIGITRTENAEEMAQLYSAATILFNPTYEDNYPTVNLESIACGTPVVTYNSGGSGEAVIKYGMGAVVGRKDYDEVKRLARMYYAEKPKLKTGVKADITSERMVKEYIDLFEGFVKQKQSSAYR